MATYVIYSSTFDSTTTSSATTYLTAARGLGTQTTDTSGTALSVGQQYSAPTYNVWQSLLIFTGLPVIRPWETVTSATLSLWCLEDQSGTDFTVEARDLGSKFRSSEILSTYTLCASTSTSGIGTGAYRDFTSESGFPESLRGETSFRFNLSSSRQRTESTPSGNEYVRFHSANQTGTTNDPKLTIVLNPAAVSGQKLYIDGVDFTNLTDLSSLSISDSGKNAVGRLRARIANTAGTASVPAGADVAWYDFDTSAVVWQGSLMSRSLAPAYARGNDIEIEAADLSVWLDRSFIGEDTIPDGYSDRAAVQYLVAAYGAAYGLSAPDATVEYTKDDVYDLYVQGRTLRQALQLVADATISVDPSGVEWDLRTPPVNQLYTGIAYNGSNLWVATAFGGTVLTSPDSYTWTAGTATSIFAAGLDYANSLYVAGAGNFVPGAGSVAAVYWSSNGTAWSSATLGTVQPEPYPDVISVDADYYWRLNDTSGTVAVATLGGVDGTYVGSPVLGTAGALTDNPTNKAVSFGTADYVTMGTAVSISTSAYSIEAWVYSTTSQTSKAIAGRWTAGTGGVMLFISSGGFYSIVHTASTANYLISATAPATNAWEHVVATWNGTNAYLYQNGTQIATRVLSTSPLTAGSPFRIAQYGTTTSFVGRLDEVAVYDTALSSATVAAHYQSGTAAYHGSPTWRQAAYGTAGWVVVGSDYTKGYAGRSTSGTASWSVTNIFSGTALSGVTYGNGRYVAVGGSTILHSASGTAWTVATTSGGSPTNLIGVGSDGTAVVAVGASGDCYYAASGTATFYRQTAPNTERMENVTWWADAGLWVAVGYTDSTWTSPDGATWTAQTTTAPGILRDVTTGADKVVAVGNNTIVGSLVEDTDPRSFWVDEIGQVHYGLTAGTAAPYAISDAPNGSTSIAAEELEVDFDESAVVNAVWAATAATDPIYGAWVEDATSIATYGRRAGILVNELIVDATTAERYGRSYVAARKDPSVRGRFAVTNKHGWKAGQVLTITNTALGLSAATYEITQVETQYLTGTGKRRYRISFGSLPKSLVRALASGD